MAHPPTEPVRPANDFKCPKCGFESPRSQALEIILLPYRKQILAYEELLKRINEFEERRLYETCPDCDTPETCGRHKVCVAMTDTGTKIQQLIQEATKERYASTNT